MKNLVLFILIILLIWTGIKTFGYIWEDFVGSRHWQRGPRRWSNYTSNGLGPWYWGYFPSWYYGPPLLNYPYYDVPINPYDWPYNGELTEYGHPTWVPWFNWPYRQRPWIYYREGFEDCRENSDGKTEKTMSSVTPKEDDTILKLGGPAPYTWKEPSKPYHLLDIPTPCQKEIISNTNSRNCYASNFQRLIEKTGSYAQQTNNYKHSRPDVCHSPYQELVMSFYKMDRLPGTGAPDS